MLNKETGELPMNRLINPMALLYAIPNRKPIDTIDLLRRCGIQILINDVPPPKERPYNPYRELAVGILLQALGDAVHGKRKERAEAKCWLLHDCDGFPYWCSIVDLDYQEVRKHLLRRMDCGCYNKDNLIVNYRETDHHATIH